MQIGGVTGTGTIIDDDNAPTIQSVTNDSKTEGTDLVHTVTLSNASSTDTSFAFTLAGNTASASDFGSPTFSNGVTLSGGNLIVPAGVTSFTVTIPTVNDNIHEASETLDLSVGGVAAVGTILDNDAVPTINTIGSPSTTEGGDLTYAVTLTNPSSTSTTYSFTLGGGTAGTSDYGTPTFTNGVTYDPVAGTITVPAGVTGFNVIVPTTQDSIDEPDETVPLHIGGVTGTGTIIDDDNAPTIQSVTNDSKVEGNALVHTVTLSNASSVDSNFAFTLGGGSSNASAGDYGTPTFSNGVTLVGGNLVVPAGVTSFTVTIPTVDDALPEANETLAISVGGVNAVGTIVDNDNAPSFSINDVSVNEAAGTATFTVTLSAASGQTVSVNYSTADGTAIAGSDYSSVNGTLTFNPGETIKTIIVPITNDILHENSETFTVNLSNPVNAIIVDAQGVGTIVDNDPVPVISAINNPSTAEGGTLVYNVNVNGTSSMPTTFTFVLGGGTATAGADYSTSAPTFSNGVTYDSSNGTISVPAGVTNFTVSVQTIDDAINEPSETVPLVIGGVTGTGTITDNDAQPSLSINDVSVNEGAGTATFTVTLSAASGQQVTVGYNTSNGTAMAGSDYTAISGTLTFAPGEITKTITVPITDDTLSEGSETFNVNLTGATNATISDNQGVGTIVDNDVAPSLTINDVSVNEAAGTATFTVTLSAVSGQSVTVNYASADGTATAGNDYGSVNGTLTFAPGETTKTITVQINNDAVHEGDETFNINLTNAVNATIADSQGVGTIVDNDPVPVINSINNPSTGEGGTLVYNVSVTGTSSTSTSFAYQLGGGTATAGSDYSTATPTFSNGVTLSGGNLIVPAGVTNFTVTVQTLDDAINEPNETVPLQIGGVTGTGTIIDNDAQPSLSINDVSVNESAGTATFTVTLSAASGQQVTVGYNTSNGTATAGSDYTATNGTLTFAPGETTKTITIAISDDTVFEGNETFNVNLTGATNATISDNLGVGTIVDNDAAPTIGSISSPSVNEGSALVYTVNVTGTSSTSTSFAYTLGGGTASAGDYGTPTFSNGVTLSGGNLIVPAGVTTFTVTLPTVDDALNEPNETVPLVIGGVTGTGTILDNDAAPSLSINDVSVNESAGTATFTVTLSAVSGQSVTVNYASSNGTATAGSDYTAVNGTLTFAPGETTKTITVQITNDTVYEGNETFNINLSSPNNATISDNLGVGTIVDNDPVPVINSVSSPTVTEGTSLVYTVNVTGTSSTSTNFAYTLGGGTASTSDYGTPTFSNGVTLSGGILSVPAGVTSFTVTLPTVDDALNETSETVPLVIGGVTGLGTINDNDAQPSLSINDVNVNEDAGTATFTVTLSTASGQPVTVGYNTSNGTATAGSDYTAVNGTLTFAPGETTKTITVPIINDTVFEGNETFNVNLVSPTNATISDNLGVGTIVDNDAAPVIASISSPSVNEGTALIYTVNVTGTSTTTTNFAYTLGGGTASTSDYGTPTFSNGVTLSGGILSVPAGVTTFTVTLPTVDDVLDEANETVPLIIGGVTGTGIILDNDPTPSLSINNVSVNESAGTATFTVTLSAASGQNVTVNYASNNGTATAGSDYTAVSGSLTFSPGQTTKTITVPIINDTVAESSETFTVTLSNPGNATIATATGTGTIIDNDQPPAIDLDGNNSTTTGNNYVTSYTENGAGISIADTDIAITDVDSSTLASATITLTNAQAGDVMTVGTMPAGITASVNGNVITLSGNASLANYQTAIRAITYSSTSENPSTTPRIINVVVNDGQSNSNTAVATINVIAVNDAPVGVADNYNGSNSVVEGKTVVRGNVLANDTDVDSTTLTVAQFATNSGSTATTVNGSNAITTALGGTVVMNADGTFTYTAPIRNHADNISDIDSFVYRASDGSLNSGWTTVQINVTDSAPVANPDTDSVGIGYRDQSTNSVASVAGNVITGAGGTGGPDMLGGDAARVSSIVFGGTTYNLTSSNTTITTTNGTLVINDTGAYTYSSNYQNKVVTSSSATAATIAGWSAAGISLFGFDGTSPLTNGNNNLSLSALTGTASGIVRQRDNSGTNNDGVGVENSNNTGNNNDRIENGEHLVLNLGMASRSTSITLTDLSAGETAQWRAYDANGALVVSGTIAGVSGNIASATISANSPFQYIVLSGTNGSAYRVNGLTATPDLTAVTPDQFTYTLTDADGSASTTTLTVSTDSVVTAIADTATVYESGLAGGTQAGNAALPVTASGNLFDNDAGVTPSTIITSVNGVTASNGTITVTDSIGTLVVNANTGAYTYTLVSKTTEGVNDHPTFNYVARDTFTNQTTNATMTVNIVDDVPIGGDIEQTLQAASTSLTYNLVIILDRSGSMATDANGNYSFQSGYDPSTVRMEIAKEALAKLIDRYDGLGNVNVKIIDFSSTASGSAAVNETDWFMDDKGNAVSYINGIQSSGGTEYSTALNETMNGFTKPAADKTLFYFITDGEPSSGFAVNATQQTQWQNFVAANGDVAFGIGIGSASLNALLPIAYPNTDADGNGVEDYAIKVNNAADLADTLLATVGSGLVTGNLGVLSGNATHGFLLGADGGAIQSVTVDGQTYTNNGSGSVSIATNKGGVLELNFVTGSYTYTLAVNKTTQNQQEVFQVTAVDGDGDAKTINLKVNLDYIANLDANRDTILTNVQTGTAITISSDALLHNDATGTSATVTSSQNAVNGSVSGSGTITFTPTAGASSGTAIKVTKEALLDNTQGGQTPINDDRANAFEMLREGFGTVLPGGQAWAVDVAGSTQVFSGTINNRSNTVRDSDYVKMALFAGERIFVDVDNQTAAMNAYVEYYDSLGVLQTVQITNTGTGTGSAPNGYFVAPTDGEFYIRVETATISTNSNTNYNLLVTLDQIQGPLSESAQFDYTVTENGVTSSATADIYHVSGTTIHGTDADEILIGGSTDDILYGGAGNDVLIGGAGNDTLYGGTGADRLDGGAGNDILNGGAGNDILIGGAGNDTLTGGLGADTFKWMLADKGAVGAPAIDTITDFDSVTGGDKLDLRDLLQGEIGQGVGTNLTNYLHFETVGSDTKVHISSSGGFSNGYNAANEDQTIILQGVNLLNGMSGDQQVIQDLITRGKLQTD
ncbi:Calx-beta domain-containing protein [uncultured Oxalicibacterium sp.]|uniref:Calx-beta domain-containing protein n=1 Tax=uncultured Oxalicibacterium sp. TaxID=1168540 RepID=UPI0025CF454F|nr:Calx-beta domain-containing protein [uncultured Oxalicibacterium sp.]